MLSVISLILALIAFSAARPDYGSKDENFGMQRDPHSWFDKHLSRKISIPKGCGGKPADVYFVVDTSDGVSTKQFEERKQFITELIDLFVLKKKQTRIGVISYGRGPIEAIRLGEFQSKRKLRKAIEGIPHVGGDRNTYAALYYLKNMGFSSSRVRRGVAHVTIFLTDGFSSDYSRTANEAHYAKKRGIYFYSVSSGSIIDKKELSSIASEPAKLFVFNSESKKIAHSLRELLSISVCSDRIQIHPAPEAEDKVCTAKRPVDVIFGIENLSINMHNTMIVFSLIEEMLMDMATSSDNIRTAVVTSRAAKLGNFGSKVSSIATTLNAIDENNMKIPDLADLLKRVRRTAHKGRKGVQKTAVIFMDDSVAVTQRAAIEAKRNKYSKIDTYVVYIGEKRSDEDVLKISSGGLDDYLIMVSNYGKLVDKDRWILGQLCRGW